MQKNKARETTMKRKNKVGGPTIPKLKTSYKPPFIKTMCYKYQNTQMKLNRLYLKQKQTYTYLTGVVSSGWNNKIAHTEWFKQQSFIFT